MSEGEEIILIGHSVKSDFDSLCLDFEGVTIRYIDTTNFRFKSGQNGKTRKLKDLVSEHLKTEIQGREHSSIEDARAAMALFLAFKDHPEKFFASNTIQVYDRKSQLGQIQEKDLKLSKKRRKMHRKDLIKKLLEKTSI